MGSSFNTLNNNPVQGSSVFGSFGNTSTQPQNMNQSTGFGNTQSSLFGQQNTQMSTPSFGFSSGSSTFGQPAQQSLPGQGGLFSSSIQSGSSLFGSGMSSGGSNIFGSNQSSGFGSSNTSNSLWGSSSAGTITGNETAQVQSTSDGCDLANVANGKSQYSQDEFRWEYYKRNDPALAGNSALQGQQNTFGSTQTGGLFGSTQQTNPQSPFGSSSFSSGGGFGSQQNTGGGLFGSSQPASTGLFGSSSTNTSGGGLFGSSQMATTSGGFVSQPNTGGLFGSSQQTTGSGLFGSSSGFGSSTTPQSTSGTLGSGLFGSTQSQNTFGGSGGGLFGSSTTPTNTSGGGLFGSNTGTATAGGFGSQQNTGGGLFGSNTGTTSAGGFGSQQNTGGGLFGTQPTSGGGLFGSTQQPTTGSGLFGSTNTNLSSGGGLFGSTSGNTTTTTTGGFAAPQPSQGTGLFGSSTFGSATTPQTTATTLGAGGSSLFGAPTGTSGTSTATGLFGSTTMPTTTGTGLFGSTNTGTTGTFGSTQPQTSGNSLFGSTGFLNTGTSSAMGTGLGSSSTGLFGTTNTASTSFGFGSTTNALNNNKSSGLSFGNYGMTNTQQQFSPDTSFILKWDFNAPTPGLKSFWSNQSDLPQEAKDYLNKLNSGSNTRVETSQNQNSESSRITSNVNNAPTDRFGLRKALRSMGVHIPNYSMLRNPREEEKEFDMYKRDSPRQEIDNALSKHYSSSTKLVQQHNAEEIFLPLHNGNMNLESFRSSSSENPVADNGDSTPSFNNTGQSLLVANDSFERRDPHIYNLVEGDVALDALYKHVEPTDVDNTNEEIPEPKEDKDEKGAKEFDKGENGCAPILTRASYTTRPTMSSLLQMDSKQLSNVMDFQIIREGFGDILWPGYTDVRNLNLDEIVDISYRKITLYSNTTTAIHEVGRGLNKTAIVTLYNCYQPDEANENYISRQVAHVNKLKDYTISLGCKFISANFKTGHWMFEVPYFIKNVENRQESGAIGYMDP
ncbi:bifunctional Nuclear pore complex protein NUP98-NUP96/Nuclear pore complex protein Nup98-Nup96-like [Babesia duncani]|uniref:Bifunctional Nuclear pore complex protein NUP98-NUP96/Nuclear pore complex protein Nup98-Nup96-like n=1 Tax=Babesia duncani TaxID=323732 RepID=A0AAD9PL75_9APIC|nr:bifunctional Nuclear pore complex protein NUP98-NUP96/Nuclear pore complex protein Nup98-Nup96-like [Babesia duncani]